MVIFQLLLLHFVPIFDRLSLLRWSLFQSISEPFPRKRGQIVRNEGQHLFLETDADLPKQPAGGQLHEPLLAGHCVGADVKNDGDQPGTFFGAFRCELEFISEQAILVPH